MKLGIIGGGFVGKATYLLKCKNIDIITYDIQEELCSPLGTTMTDICVCDIIFISVPTPMQKNGSCYLKIIESVLEEIKKYVNLSNKLVVLRSTVPVGISDKYNCYFMPEFLTEKNFENDFINNKNWIFGLKNTEQDEKFKESINFLINNCCDEGAIKSREIKFVKNKEAELIKLFRNNFLAVKVSFCNEIYKFCEKMDINYENIANIAASDPRIGSSHISVPGHDGRFGYGGTCFPKDTHNLYYQMITNGVDSRIIRGAIERNETIDRVEKDWNDNKGRAVV
jgi:nucleotide sugar dehydrogenase